MNFKFIKYIDSKVEINRHVFLVLSLIIIGFISYGVIFNGLILNNDSVRRVAGMSNDARLISGRFLIGPIYDYIYQNQIFPTVLFFHLIFLNSINSIIIFKIFKIESFFYQLVIASLVFSFPVMSFYIPYGQDITAYSLSMLLSLISAYILTRYKLDYWLLLAVLCMVLSLGIYQAFVSITLSIFILDAYVNKYNGINIKYLLSWSLKTLFLVAFSFICYFALLKLILFMSNTSMGGYRNASSISFMYIINSFPHLLENSYLKFYDYLIGTSKIFNKRFHLVIVNFIFICSFLYYGFVKFGKFKWIIASIVFFMIFIPAMYTVDIITGSNLYYTQVGLLSFLISFPILIYNTKLRYSNVIALVFIVCVHLSFLQINNYLNLFSKLTESSYKIAFKISNDLLESEYYYKDDKVLFLGSLKENTYFSLPETKTFDDINSTYLWGTFPGYGVHSTIKRNRRDVGYLIEDLGFNINYASSSDISMINESDIIKIINSPSYPKGGYITKTSGLIVINLGGVTKKDFK